MSQENNILKVLEYAATHWCFKGNKKSTDCQCPPCLARKLRFGKNIPVQLQEPALAELKRLKAQKTKDN